MKINQKAVNFELPDLAGTIQRLDDHRGRVVILNFWSCECPHSERADGLITGWLEGWGGEVTLLSIAANRNESVQSVEKASEARNLPMVLLDAGHAIADLYKAVTTPHVFVVDRDGVLRYSGAVDDVTFRKRKASRFYLKEVVDALLEGRSPALTETRAYGCAIVREI